MLQQKIDDIERKLTNRIQEVQSLEQKIHMLCQSESSQKNELNFWNGKVSTLKRDLDYYQTFAENIQVQNRKLQEEAAEYQRVIEQREKDLVLAKKEITGLKEDNERQNRMYKLLEREAFQKNEILKKDIPISPIHPSHHQVSH